MRDVVIHPLMFVIHCVHMTTMWSNFMSLLSPALGIDCEPVTGFPDISAQGPPKATPGDISGVHTTLGIQLRSVGCLLYAASSVLPFPIGLVEELTQSSQNPILPCSSPAWLPGLPSRVYYVIQTNCLTLFCISQRCLLCLRTNCGP